MHIDTTSKWSGSQLSVWQEAWEAAHFQQMERRVCSLDIWGCTGTLFLSKEEWRIGKGTEEDGKPGMAASQLRWLFDFDKTAASDGAWP